MMTCSQILTFSVLFFAYPLAAGAQETPSDPRLDVILKEVAAIRETVAAEKQKRTAKYIADLKELEKTTQSTGNLDKVLQVSKERAAWESGKPTPAFDPKDEAVMLGLRKLRYYYDEEITTIRDTAQINSEQQRKQIGDKFIALEKALTTEGKISQAIEVRTLREQFIAGTVDAAPATAGNGKPLATVMPTAASKLKATGQTTFPLPDPEGYPPLPTEKGRIVFVQFPNVPANFDQNALKEIERDNYDDIVALGKYGHLGIFAAIRADGSPVAWKSNGEKVAPRRVSAVKVWCGLGADLLWVDDEGHAGGSGGDTKIGKQVEKLGKVRYISPVQGLVFAIDGTGERHLIGPSGENPNVIRAFEDKKTIIAAEFAGPNFILVLKNDGSTMFFVTGKPPVGHGPPQSLKSLFSFSAAVTASGEFSTHAGGVGLATALNGLGKNVRQCNQNGSYATIQLESGEWTIFNNENRQWQRSEKFEQALAGAFDIYPTKQGILAILPASSVPRSGLWELDKLIEARK